MPDELYDGPSLLGPDQAPPGAFGQGQRFARFVIVPLVLLFFVIVLVFYVLFGFTRVVGQSMAPTLYSADGLLLTKSYSRPQRGDIIVAHVTDRDGRPEDIVKRVVALPGDRVEVRDDWAIVNGVPESGYEVLRVQGQGVDQAESVIPEGTLYVLGDNRPVSLDSRFIGPLPKESIQGKAVAVFMPITRVQLLP